MQAKKRKKRKKIFFLWITFLWIRLVFPIDHESKLAYSASVGIRAEPAPGVAIMPHLIFIFAVSKNWHTFC
jgi:hypothetical protein